MDDPVNRAEEMRTAYRDYFIGRGGRAARSVESRLADGEDGISGMRGPYLQALDIPNWSNRSWETFAQSSQLEPHIRRAFSQIGFERLYDFQERSIEAILEGDDTVITAATGRGKTEAWLIPILNRILETKRRGDDEEDTSVKATLIYPTKALAQDQLKRLLQYLYLINKHLKSKHRITVGIYDGDTPRNVSESGSEGYLNATFRHFECPGYNDELSKCQDCGGGVRIRNMGSRFKLIPEKADCEDDTPNDVPLDFLRLTKYDILENGVDILLTNPDTINYRLINTNAEDEHERFIYEPEFLVFDEVHTYDGLFGSYTSMLMKRVQKLRKARGTNNLQLIASSATVENDVELFQKVSGAIDVTQVSESPRELDDVTPSTVPEQLVRETLSTDRILQATADPDDTIPGVGSFNYTLENASQYNRDRREALVADALFDHLTEERDDPGVQVVQYVHQLLYDDPLTRQQLHDKVASALSLGKDEAETLVANVRTLGEFSGILENRSHVFSWPIDGFYTCPACDAVYRSPQDDCRECGFEFITRATYCRHCSDEHLIAWYCPECDQLEPYTPTEHGSVSQDEVHICKRCETAREEEVEMVRTTFQPYLRCRDCGQTTERTTTHECDDCTARTVRTDSDTFSCINPACESTHQVERTCQSCAGADFEIVASDGRFDCPDCGTIYEQSDEVPNNCGDCGSALTSTKYVPWVCSNDGCGRIHFDGTPERCDCGSTSFVKRGLFEVQRDQHCQACDTAFLGSEGCDCDDPEVHPRIGSHQAYKTLDTQGRIHTMSDQSIAVPCPHRYARYEIGRRFDELMRSPNNLAATTSQYLLRAVADDEGQQAAKLLSFADSHRDMKELSRDFSEPEVETLLDQLLVGGATASDDETTWAPFDSVLKYANDAIENLNETLEPPRVAQNVEFDLKSRLKNQPRRRWDDDDSLRDRLTRRALPHVYSQRLGERDDPLSAVGLLDVRFAPGLDALSSDERTIVRDLIVEGNDYRVEKFNDPSADRSAEAVVAELVDREILGYGHSETYVSFAPSALSVTVAGDDDGIGFDPDSERYYTTLQRQFGLDSSETVPSGASLSERASSTHPRFTQRAHRIEYSGTRILISEEYLGTTDKRKRRELEFLFREENYPHHLSSGPTMELGVDIGALDALLLYGTPPNMNAYLQRVGRAGRSSHSSMVHSVSQRNPIDYYYYDHPEKLIDTDPTPVPLNEHNEEVLRVSLSWAIFDYVAAHFSIPWDVSHYGRAKSIDGGDTYHRRSMRDLDDREDASKLTHVMSITADTLSLGNDDSKLAVLGEAVDDHQSEVEDHLTALLDYQYCEDCERRYAATDDRTDCERSDCDGRVVYACDRFGHLVEEALIRFEDRYITHFREYEQSLEDELATLRRRNRKLRREMQRAGPDDRGRIMSERRGLMDRTDVLDDYLSELGRSSYFDFLRESRESKYDFSMRSVATTVGFTLVDEGYDRRAIGDQGSGRAMRMALSELHPGAAYLDGRETYTVARVRFDEKSGSDLREAVNGTVDEENHLAEELVCPACHSTFGLNTAECDCEANVPLKRRRLAVLNSVDAYYDNLQLTSDGDEARYLHDEPNLEVQNTYAERETAILNFEANRTFELQTDEGDCLGTLEYGDYSVLLSTDGYRTKYKSGEVDPRETLFEVCGEENCPGVIYKDGDDERRCSADPDHFPDGRGADSEFVRLGYRYDTQGVRINLDDHDLSHTLAHGLRVALQYLGGVTIRELAEHVGEDQVDIFESQEGGADVARLLFEQSGGEFRAFDRGVNLMREQFDCDCENGCPSCLYQYGCDVRNDQRSFDRDGLRPILEGRGLSIQPIENESVDEQLDE
ncbi:DEAD/DEAH box helicase [Halomarina oriensis]|uniref:DEAD/DEAH box helicase n=1 Tax=Halomarina oriensis TaxID=671145 RepID=A0A6B0GR84_9EURY|nr:DEAD/DEAH box helicase [Halomarina oriensis]MWG36099.1 DEAD/DEAH box helicase [Halomarina oriensis]